MNAIESRVDPAVMRVLAARRRAIETDASEKLARIRRLELQTVLRELPETRVEQSFNEQLFAHVLGYRTLLSHDDAGTFHLMPKDLMQLRKLNDFSLGFFGGDTTRRIVTAEFKSPGVDLDKPQASSYDGITPVEQAFVAARDHITCRFVIVSNFHKLRLYSIDERLLCVGDLLRVRTPDDLALLCAHFDRAALLGDGQKEEPEMSITLEGHPVRPYKKASGHYRAQWLFTPTREGNSPRPLFAIEKRLRLALESSRARWGEFKHPNRYQDEDESGIQIEVASGWLFAESQAGDRKLRVSVSRAGQIVLSALVPTGQSAMNVDAYFKPYQLEDLGAFFGHLLREIADDWVPVGEIELTLTDVAGFKLHGDIDKIATGNELWGRAAVGGIPRPDFIAGALTTCICEVVVQFRDKEGGMLWDQADTQKTLTRWLDVTPKEPGLK